LNLRVAQVPANIRIGDLFWNGEEHDQREQNSQQNGKTKQSSDQRRALPKGRFYFGSNYARNH
jgi:GTP-dependent phosphoenolpyruvate carboxykinase